MPDDGLRGVAQPGRALVSGSRGRRFEAGLPDHHARFWSRVDVGPRSQCWPWRGGTDRHGYGVTGFGSRRAHRVAFDLFFGEPSGHVMHSCDNPICCNPHHLRDGTHSDNMRDMAQKGRSGGQRHSTTTILRAKQLLAARVSQRLVAEATGLSKSYVGKISRGEKCAWLQAEPPK